MSGDLPLLPLFPLPNVVHFPGTLLPLHIFEPRYRAMVRDLLALPESERLVGMILAQPLEEGETPGFGLVPPGTAGRLVAVEPLDDGRYEILLHGEFRFFVEEELGGRPYLRARVQPLEEGAAPPDILRETLVRDLAEVALESGESFPLAADEIAGLLAHAGLPEIVNRLAAGLDLPIGSRQAMLALDLAPRAAAVAATMASRRKLLAALRPFRHLAPHAASN